MFVNVRMLAKGTMLLYLANLDIACLST